MIDMNENHRLVGIHHFRDDDTVSFAHAILFESQMKRQRYKVSTWYPTAGNSSNHDNMYLSRPYQSATKLCDFFTEAFHHKRSWCDLQSMYQRCDNQFSGAPMRWKPFWQVMVIIPILTALHLF